MMELFEPEGERFHGALLGGFCRLIVEASEGKYEAVIRGAHKAFGLIFAAGTDRGSAELRIGIEEGELRVTFLDPLPDESTNEIDLWPVHSLYLSLEDPGVLDRALAETGSYLAARQAGVLEEWLEERRRPPSPEFEEKFRKWLGQ